jgi:BON domain/PRC-barrel domain
MSRNDWLASTWIGRPVRNRAGDTIGRIEELILDPANGAVTLAILSCGDWLAIGDRLVPLPWNALSYAPGRDYVLLGIDKTVLEGAPAFDRQRWPDVSDTAWRTRVYGYFGYPLPVPAREPATVITRERYPPRKALSVFAVLFMVLILLGLFGFTYMVATRGWDQTRNDILKPLQGVTYAMQDVSVDAALTAKVKTALSLNKQVPAGKINVDSNDGVVTLRGAVSDEKSREIAEKVATDTPGVREVHNEVSVAVPGH